VVRYILKAPLNIDLWNFRRIWAWLKVSTSSYYFLTLVIIAVFTAPLWLDLVSTVRGSLFTLFENGPETDANGKTIDLRGHFYAIGILITAFAALFTAPLALLKAYINERQTTAAEQGLITDRFTKAVEQLGAEKTVRRVETKPLYKKDANGEWLRDTEDNPMPATRPDGKPLIEYESIEETEPDLEARLGAIYALERIAQDSERDHIPVMETLCAYIRQNAPANSAKDQTLGDWPDWPEDADDAALAERRTALGTRREDIMNWARALPAPRVDIQAALSVIGRRGEERIARERRHHKDIQQAGSGFRLDLRGANLQRANLYHAQLDHALLSRARLEGARLSEAGLEGVVLGGSKSEGSIVVWASPGTDLGGARLEKSDLGWARLGGAILVGTRLEDAMLAEARLEGANLYRATLGRAYLGRAHLEGARL
jgi:hypothetical protein